MNSDGLKQKMISGSFWSSLEKVVMEAVSFLVFLVLARLLQPTDYGILAIALVFVTLLGNVAGLGISGAVVQIRDLQPTHLSSGFWSTFLVGVLMYTIVYACAPHLALFYNEPALEYVLICLGLIGVLNALEAVPRALLSRHFRFRFLAFRSFLSTLVGGVVGITMAFNGYGFWALVAQQLTVTLLRTTLTWLGAGWIPSLQVSWSPLKNLLSVGLYIMGSRLSNTFSRQTDNLLIGTFLGSRELGVYSIGVKVSRTANSVLLHSLSRLGLPTFSRLQGSADKLENAYQRVWTMGAALTLPVFVLVMLTAQDLVPLLFGHQWQDSATVLQILMIASCCLALNNFDSPLLVACGKAKLAFRLTIARTILNVIGFAIAVNWGINAVAAALAIAGLIMLPVWKLAIEKYSPVSVKIASGQLLSVAYGLAGLSVVVWLLGFLLPDTPDLYRIASQWSLGLVIYCAVVYALDRSLRSEMRDLLNLGFGKL